MVSSRSMMVGSSIRYRTSSIIDLSQSDETSTTNTSASHSIKKLPIFESTRDKTDHRNDVGV